MIYRYDFLADRRNVVSSVYLSQTIRRFRSKQTFDRLNTKRCTHVFKRTGIRSKKRCENTKRSMQRLFEYLDVSTFSISMASCLLENSWNALGLFGGRSPLFTFLVFSISTSLIFSRPNAKGRWPPLLLAPGNRGSCLSKAASNNGFYFHCSSWPSSSSSCRKLFHSYSVYFFTKFTYFYETSSDTVTGYHFTKKK